MDYNKIYSKRKDLVTIDVDHVYMIIPKEYICTYHKLLIGLSDMGMDMFHDCSSNCKESNKTIITCWNMFQGAIAAKQLKQDKQADLLINYINSQLNIIVNGNNIELHDDSLVLPITNDGKLEAIISCKEPPTFEVDLETGKLYSKYLDSTTDDAIYSINDEV